MKVKILKTTVASGHIVQAGQSVDLKDDEAKTLIRMGKAELHQKKSSNKKPDPPDQSTAKASNGEKDGDDNGDNKGTA